MSPKFALYLSQKKGLNVNRRFNLVSPMLEIGPGKVMGSMPRRGLWSRITRDHHDYSKSIPLAKLCPTVLCTV